MDDGSGNTQNVNKLNIAQNEICHIMVDLSSYCRQRVYCRICNVFMVVVHWFNILSFLQNSLPMHNTSLLRPVLDNQIHRFENKYGFLIHNGNNPWYCQGLYRCTQSMAIAPFWFSTEQLLTALMSFWYSQLMICPILLNIFVAGAAPELWELQGADQRGREIRALPQQPPPPPPSALPGTRLSLSWLQPSPRSGSLSWS